ncbi:MAG: sigma 54-interacting transcriptional regulator [Acidobacteriota bacterium]
MPDYDESTVAPKARRPGLGRSGRRAQPLPCLTILAHPDAGRIGDRAILGELVVGHPCELARHRPDFVAPGAMAGRPLADRYLSRRPLLLEPATDGWRLDATSTSTPVRVDGEHVRGARHLDSAALERGLVLELADRIVLLLHLSTPSAEPDVAVEGLVGHSDAAVELRREIRRVAELDVGVLLRGETGAGKEVVASALHSLSRHASGPFVAVNLGALPPSLAAAELFGAERGAFTGAGAARDGCFTRADGGTLFLDEIGEAPTEVQVSMLRTLETGEVWPLGASKPRRVQVRTVAATDADLEARIADGAFKAPLLHRLAGYEILLPPLRGRRDDVGRLLLHFFRERARALDENPFGDGAEPWIDCGLVQRLAAHPWPGNVRQLRNVAGQLVIGNRGRTPMSSVPAVSRLLDAAEDPKVDDTTPATGPPQGSPRTPPQVARKPADIDDDEILETLRRRRFEVKAAAQSLGISRAALYLWIEQSARVKTAGQLDAEAIRRAHSELAGDLTAMAKRLEVSRFSLRRRLRELGL